MVQPSHRVHVSWQRLADSGPKEEKRGEWIIALDLHLFSPVIFGWPWLSLRSSCCVDHREETQRPHQPQPVRAQEAGSQCFWKTGYYSPNKNQLKSLFLFFILLIKTTNTISATEVMNQLYKIWFKRVKCCLFPLQGSSKLEKAEILQMTVDHLKLLHAMGGKGETSECIACKTVFSTFSVSISSMFGGTLSQKALEIML